MVTKLDFGICAQTKLTPTISAMAVMISLTLLKSRKKINLKLKKAKRKKRYSRNSLRIKNFSQKFSTIILKNLAKF